MERVKMTHNEYRGFLKLNANRIYKEEGYSYKHYCEDAANVDILPFELSEYNLPEEIVKTINNIFTEETTSSKGEYMLKGFAESEDEWYEISDKLNLQRVTGYFYSGYCYNNDLKFYMTYCEGTLYLKLFQSEEEYKESLKNTIEWYKSN